MNKQDMMVPGIGGDAKYAKNDVFSKNERKYNKPS